MLRPIPAKIMRTDATVKVCTGVDRYQNQTYTEYAVKKVHLQPTNEVRKTQDNRDVVLRSVLFVDARVSSPVLDWTGLFQAAQVNRGDMRVIVRGETYTVIGIDALRDDTDTLHHWEVSLV
jgi:hypothetical protein